MTQELPKASRICICMETARENNEVKDGSVSLEGTTSLFYGPARLMITQRLPTLDNRGAVLEAEDEAILVQMTWDHSDGSLAEAADAARRRGGRVFVGQDVFMWASGAVGQVEPVCEGFSFEVWPNWTGGIAE